MAYRITYKKSVAGDLKRLDKQTARRLLDRIESALSNNPERFPALRGPFAGLRKCRIGDYRVIFTIIAGTVLVLRIQHRKEVYRE